MSDISNPVALVLEIVSALVALGALIAMLVQLLRATRARGRGEVYPVGQGEKHAGHMRLGIVMVLAAAVHGVSAMVYDSGALAATYVFGWLAAVSLACSALAMAPVLRERLGEGAVAWHRGLFILAVAFLIVHIVAGRL